MTVSSNANARPFARFIPSEEISAVSEWRFGAVGAPLLAPVPIEVLPEPETEPEIPVQQQLERAWEEGYQAGFAQGHAEAASAGARQLDDFVQGQGAESADKLAELVTALEARLAAAEQNIAQQVLALASGLARQVIRRELSQDPEAVLPVVREALGMLVMDGKPAVVKLHPEDLALLEAPLREEFPSLGIHWLGDATVAPGDCLVESGGTVIDGGVAKRWERAVANLGLATAWATPEALAHGD